jgi:hypothetical protein
MADRQAEFKGDFSEDVPSHLQDNVLQRIVEAAYGYTEEPEITIIDVEHLDALNIEFTGTITFEGREHSFHIRDGNNNGTEIISWNGDIEIEKEPPVNFTIAPLTYKISDAIQAGTAAELLKKWDRDCTQDDNIAPLARNYAYDRFFAPGGAAAMAHKKKAEKYGYEIVEACDAQAVRKRLVKQAISIRPSGTWPMVDPEQARATYEMWADCRTAGALSEVIEDMAERLSTSTGLSPDADEIARLGALGFRFTSRRDESAAWQAGLSGLYVLREIEGFDHETLPEDPMKVLLQRFDPALVHDTRVSPKSVCDRLLMSITSRMTRERVFELRDEDCKAFEAYGYVLEDRIAEEPSSEYSPEL